MSEDRADATDVLAPHVAAQGRALQDAGTTTPQVTTPTATAPATYADGADPETWNDRRHPPFEEGNDAAVTNGARSPRRIDEVARRINPELLTRYEWAADFPETVTALARAEAVTQMLFRDLVQNGHRDKTGKVRGDLISRWATAENLAARLRQSLGMTPESEASVARDRAAALATASALDLGALARRGQEAFDARDRLQGLAHPAHQEHDGQNDHDREDD